MNAQTAAMFGSAINYSTARDLYPTAPGPTTAEIGAAATPFTTDASSAATMDASNAAATNAAPASATVAGQPLVWFGALIVLFIGLGIVGHKLGGREGETGVHNLRFSAYNILFITLAAVIGITAFKVVFTRLNVPGLTTLVQTV